MNNIGQRPHPFVLYAQKEDTDTTQGEKEDRDEDEDDDDDDNNNHGGLTELVRDKLKEILKPVIPSPEPATPSAKKT